ncbi:MAG: glycosyltransferase family 9 protein [Proteobacteria bacterium]|nr:glycosyltransferase family 9 protein [Pseudomonadota bacterium]
MRFMVVNRAARAEIFGQSYDLKPLSPRQFEAKNILVSDSGSAGELLQRHSSVLLEASFDTSALPAFPRTPKAIDRITAGSKVLILRAGGVGDLVMMLPALKTLKHSLPNDAEVWFATQKEKHPVFHMNPGIDKLLPLPLTLDQLIEADFLFDFSYNIDNRDFNSMNMTDYYLKCFGLDEKSCHDKSPLIPPNPSNGYRLRKVINKLKKASPHKALIVLQCHSSNPLRNLPPGMFFQLAEYFPDVRFVSATHFSEELPGDHADPLLHKNIKDISADIRSLEDYITLFEVCDGVVSTDTAAYHLAEAFGKPSLTIFGPISSDLRIRYYRKALAIDASYEGKTCSAPCGLHKTKEGCPDSLSRGIGYSPCLLSVEPQTIKSAFKQMLDQFM